MLDVTSRERVEARSLASASIAVVILTYNEEAHIRRAIDSVREIADDIVVVDSFSTDATVAIAAGAGARVVQHAWTNPSHQFNWALDNAGVDADWILRLDADEVIEPDLRARIATFVRQAPADVVAVNFKRKHVFMGRWIRFGGRYPLLLLRLWRRGYGRVENRWMDEHVTTWGGRTITLEGGFADVSLHDLSRFIDKHNKYATLLAVDVLCKRYGNSMSQAKELNSQARVKRMIKDRVYDRLPFYVGPTLYFLYRYIFQLGFLDGRPGLIYHFMQGFWYRFLAGAKLMEFEGQLADCATPAERLAKLRRLTGLSVTMTDGS